MADTIQIDGQDYPISGYAADGLPIIKAVATTTQDGYDAEGNPKQSVQITVPPVTIGITPGKVE